MSPAQRKVARHALGLPNPLKTSKGNAAAHLPGTLHALVFDELVAAGVAVCKAIDSERRSYSLTPTSAQAALEPGETLSLADFPPANLPTAHPSTLF